jgi:hypothetical protein
VRATRSGGSGGAAQPIESVAMRRILPVLLLLAAPALAQGLPTSKPPPLGATGHPPPATGAAPSASPQRCAAPLANGCLRMQASCQMACPPLWSMNPNAPAFTPTDRAGCMRRCQQQYFSCLRTYGC